MAKKEMVMGGLSGLLTPTPTPAPTPAYVEEPAQELTPKGRKKTDKGKIVCYNLNSDLVEKIKKIAYYERKKINEVITEALEAHIANWVPKVEEPPKL